MEKPKLNPESGNIAEYFSKSVFAIQISEEWQKKGVLPPNDKCKEITIDLLLFLYHQFSLLPIKIFATVENGLFLKYKNLSNDRELVIEIDNDYDVAALIYIGKKILGTYDIIDVKKDFSNIINELNKPSLQF